MNEKEIIYSVRLREIDLNNIKAIRDHFPEGAGVTMILAIRMALAIYAEIIRKEKAK